MAHSSNWRNSNGKDPYTCLNCGAKSFINYNHCPECKIEMSNGAEPLNCILNKKDVVYSVWGNIGSKYICGACLSSSVNKHKICIKCGSVMLNGDVQ